MKKVYALLALQAIVLFTGFAPVKPYMPPATNYYTITGGNLASSIWSGTASETRSDYFTVERSADGQHWTEVLRTRAAGSSSMPKPITSRCRASRTTGSGKQIRTELSAFHR